MEGTGAALAQQVITGSEQVSDFEREKFLFGMALSSLIRNIAKIAPAFTSESELLSLSAPFLSRMARSENSQPSKKDWEELDAATRGAWYKLSGLTVTALAPLPMPGGILGWTREAVYFLSGRGVSNAPRGVIQRIQALEAGLKPLCEKIRQFVQQPEETANKIGKRE